MRMSDWSSDVCSSDLAIDLRRHPAGAPLAAGLRRAFVYSDCWVQDSRLVVLNALDAAERGAEVLTRTECLSARREGERWRVVLRDGRNGPQREVLARALGKDRKSVV